MTRYWPYAVVAIAGVAAALLWPLTPALPSTVAITARLASAVTIGLVCIAVASRNVPGRATTLIASAVCGVAGLILVLVHFDAQTRCVADYEGRPVIIGTTLTADIQPYVQKNPSLSASDLVFDAGGVAERIWTADSIRSCTLLVAWPGVGAIPLLATAAALLIRRRPYLLAARASGVPSPVTVQTAAPVYDAFLSYRHVEPDRSIAFDLVDSLEREGLRTAIDARDFSPNEHFLSEMERCIKQSRFVLCVITPQYVRSDHTSEEAIISKTLDLAERRRRLVPLIYERVALPVWLHGLVGIDFTSGASVDPHERLLRLLKTPDAGRAGERAIEPTRT